MKKAILILFILLFFARLVTVFINRAFHTPYSRTGREIRVDVKAGTPADKIIASLHLQGVIRSPGTFKMLLYLSRNTDKIKAGEYAFRGRLTPLQVMQTLVRGEIVYQKITIPEGLTIEETARIVAQLPFLSEEKFIRQANNAELISSIDPEAADLEGYLFPDTYFLTKERSAKQLVSMMANRFIQIFKPEWLKRTEELGFSIRDIVTLASLIEKETSLPNEKYLISSVFHNRLKKNMLLQCDPTIIYAMKKAGVYRGCLLKADLLFDSPYNTYMNPWIPPGPIASPGRDSIRAALYPDTTSYYYFVSQNDGSHSFSRTIEEHNRMVLKYRR